MKHHLLFICSENVNRSPTAESLFSDSILYEAKSGGIGRNPVVRISQDAIDWADVVFVMSEKEDGHLTLLENIFNLKGKLVCDLDIADDYDKGDPELIQLLRKKIKEFMLVRGFPIDRESLG